MSLDIISLGGGVVLQLDKVEPDRFCFKKMSMSPSSAPTKMPSVPARRLRGDPETQLAIQLEAKKFEGHQTLPYLKTMETKPDPDYNSSL